MTHIWVPKAKILEASIDNKVGLSGEYTIRKYKAGTNELIQQVGPFKNVITNIGLDRAGVNPPATTMFIGTGTTPPSAVDTQLAAFKFGVTRPAPSGAWGDAVIQGGPPDYWVQASFTARFNPGEATGIVTEVGAGWSEGGVNAANHRVFSRSLVLDTLGRPVTITVLADEYLDVTYGLRYYPYTGPDYVRNLNISGINHTLNMRPYGLGTNVTNYVNGGQRVKTNDPMQVFTGTAGSPPTLDTVTSAGLANKGLGASLAATEQTYVPGSLTRAATHTAGLTVANLAYGIRGVHFTYRDGSFWSNSFFIAAHQATIDPPIMKDNTKILSFGSSISWGRKT